MNQNKLSFESENLVVDGIGFNIAGLMDPTEIGVYLSKSFGFNSVLKQTSKGKSESLIFGIVNSYKVSFIKLIRNRRDIGLERQLAFQVRMLLTSISLFNRNLLISVSFRQFNLDA